MTSVEATPAGDTATAAAPLSDDLLESTLQSNSSDCELVSTCTQNRQSSLPLSTGNHNRDIVHNAAQRDQENDSRSNAAATETVSQQAASITTTNTTHISNANNTSNSNKNTVIDICDNDDDKSREANVVVELMDEEDDELIDEEQLTEFKHQLVALGSFADKVTINTLSMIAEDYKDSLRPATQLYQVLRQRLLSALPHEKLPVIYLLDSILKNCRACFVTLVEHDAVHWMASVHAALGGNGSHNNTNNPQQAKLQKVWRTWNEFNLFSLTAWKNMGRCFTETNSLAVPGGNAAMNDNSASFPPQPLLYPPVAGISRMKDGSLILSSGLQREMQNILDDMQSGIQNELEKVSLQRLADINPDLLANIKSAAEEAVGLGLQRNGSRRNEPSRSTTTSQASSSPVSSTAQGPSFLVEIRSNDALARSNEWHDFMTNKSRQQQQPNLEQETNQIVTTLKDIVMAGTIVEFSNSSTEKNTVVYTQKEALRMTGYFATCLTVAQLLSTTLERQNTLQLDSKHHDISTRNTNGKAQLSSRHQHQRHVAIVNPSDFTNEGIKQSNPSAISLLYEIGLPFQSIADGLRFPTQQELSNHLDMLFKKNQLRKTMAITEERGWYASEREWTRQEGEGNRAAVLSHEAEAGDHSASTTTNFNTNSKSNLVPADETRESCVVCGLQFKMIFDNDDGIYKYTNCVEVPVQKQRYDADDAGDEQQQLENTELYDEQLVHVTCWTGLGEPTLLTYDQTLHRGA